MIPIIYPHGSTSFLPTAISNILSNGLGRIPECTECVVAQNAEQQFECRFTVPTNARHYADIVEGNIIACKLPELDSLQAFDIYGRDETINGLTTFYANHISYRLNSLIMKPAEMEYEYASALAAALNNSNLYYNALGDFRFWSDVTAVLGVELSNKTPTPMRKIIIDLFNEWNGEDVNVEDRRMGIIWDNFQTRISADAGTDTNINVYYGKNITDYNRNLDYSEVFNACVPYAVNNSGEVWTLEQASGGAQSIVALSGINPADWIVQPADVSEYLSDPETWPPSASELSALGLQWLQDNAVNIPIQNTEISFEQLWETQDYATIAALEQVKLYDRLNVVYGPGKVKLENVPIVATEYDVLNERYASMQLGAIQQNYGDTVRGIIENTLPKGIDGQTIQIQINPHFNGVETVWDTVEAKLKRGIICLND